MSTHYNPKIVTDGLVLTLDAANQKSYPGSGTTWSDLSANDNDMTLYNGPGYVSDNGGYLSFDQTSDYGEITARNTNLEFQPQDPFTVYGWFYIGGVSTQAYLANMVSGSGYPGWDLWINSSTVISMHLISTWSSDAIKIGAPFDQGSYLNKWVCIAYTYDGSCPVSGDDPRNSVEWYFDGELFTGTKSNLGGVFTSSSSTITYNTSQRFRIASRWGGGGSTAGGLPRISNIAVYNKALTAAEVKQNFEATRGRFGI